MANQRYWTKKKACNKCRNLKKMEFRNWQYLSIQVSDYFFFVHRNVFKGSLGKKSSFKGRLFSAKDSCSSTFWCFHLFPEYQALTVFWDTLQNIRSKLISAGLEQALWGWTCQQLESSTKFLQFQYPCYQRSYLLTN